MSASGAFLALKEATARIVGLPVWGASIGVGSFLTLEFGAAHLVTPRLTRGGFHLWVQGAVWEIRKEGALLAHNEMDRDQMIAAAKYFDGQIVEAVQVDLDTLAMRLVVSAGMELAAACADDPYMEIWTLYLDDGMVLTAESDTTLDYSSAQYSAPLPEG